MRYDHISDRQKRDDMYTEIDDISKRVEGLLAEAQSEPTHDDVARLALDYGWQVTLTAGGRKHIATNISTIGQLASIVPEALGNVYGTRNINTTPISLQKPSPITSSCSNPESDVVHLPVRTSLQQYMQPYDIQPTLSTCPCMLTFIMSPSLLLSASNDPELLTLGAMIHSDASLYCCIHNPQSPFVPDALSPIQSTISLPQLTRFGDCNISNVYWNLIKTARLIDQSQFNQAYINIGSTITKALSLELHKPSTVFNATSIEAEIRRRIFWAMWLLDTQIPLLLERRTTIQLDSIQIERPRTWDGMTDEDKGYTECLQYLIDVRWLRMKIEQNIQSMMDEKDEHKLLNMVIQQVRQLRRFYERVDDKYNVEMINSTDPCTQWQRRCLFILLLEYALNWLVLFDRFLPAVPDPTNTSGKRFPDNLAVSMCRQASDLMTLVFEKWVWDKYDCQFRLFFNHLCNTVSVHKYLCRCPGVSTVHKWKAYASLQFIYNLVVRIPDMHNCTLAQKLLEDIAYALEDLRDVAEIGWSPNDDLNVIESITKYFSEWKPSYDPLPPYDSMSLFAKESATMLTIIEMRKKAAQDMISLPV
ncbi:hypothetical protein LRAMOSA06785 [Lichtheimia ramosa]|uniref:Xylanolytic transcriptional activator regulatory domain-containing protein n=1 Tax=Lichtheimia ramosa TaxID=688394 RepID=A0A077WAN8_9FUNG|nr:hypothetical protein LRAMOSA06785 [Lichtheimia ramosa]